ncbi:cysteine hydrolase family protein [Pseudaminobacter salicylatoxidans]|uniref:cysteine hydrolase family protein n=1 Tax=Pseudaminobacter salicylatoxidans TaxID=93369 RepID=UPI0003826C03|nr:cysteine hydrolase [Pseudaminobacter salicylatoxidans]
MRIRDTAGDSVRNRVEHVVDAEGGAPAVLESTVSAAAGLDHLVGVTAANVDLADRVERPALIVVDLQNDFVREGAPLEVPEARATLGVNRMLIDFFRANGWPVIFTRFVSRPTDAHFWRWSPQCDPREKCCWAGHHRRYLDSPGMWECIAVVDELAPAAADIVIDKNFYGAFHGTGLSAMLENLGVKSVIVTGTVTQICVDQTAREAFQHGFNAVVVSDAVSSSSPELAAYALENIRRKFGWVTSSAELLSWLQSGRNTRSSRDTGSN